MAAKGEQVTIKVVGMLLDALDAALAGQWIEESADGYRFRYPLVRHTLGTALSRERRAQLRRRAAEVRQVDGG